MPWLHIIKENIYKMKFAGLVKSCRLFTDCRRGKYGAVSLPLNSALTTNR